MLAVLVASHARMQEQMGPAATLMRQLYSHSAANVAAAPTPAPAQHSAAATTAAAAPQPAAATLVRSAACPFGWLFADSDAGAECCGTQVMLAL